MFAVCLLVVCWSFARQQYAKSFIFAGNCSLFARLLKKYRPLYTNWNVKRIVEWHLWRLWHLKRIYKQNKRTVTDFFCSLLCKNAEPVILKIDAAKEYSDCVKFYKGNDKVVLADFVSPAYISMRYFAPVHLEQVLFSFCHKSNKHFVKMTKV